MNGCESITTAASGSKSAAPSANTIVQAALFSEILKPMAAGLGPVGDIAVASVAQALFVMRP